MRDVIVRWPRSTLALSVLVLACASTMVVPAWRTSPLRSLGWALVVDDPIEPAEVVVVEAEAGGAGVLEAADLQHRGIAMRIAVFTDPPDPEIDQEFIRRGVPYEDAAERSIRQLRSLGIATVDQIPRSDAANENEESVLLDWCDRHHIGSVIVVASSHHSRRLRRALHRAMLGHQTIVTVRSARYSDFDPDHWWQTRGGIRMEIVESQRLLLDIARHPVF